MRSCLTLLLLYLVIKVVLLAVSLGIGWMLHWLVPAIDFGVAVLISLITTIASFYAFVRVSTLPLPDESPIEIIPAPITILETLDALPRRQRRKRKNTPPAGPAA